MSTNATESVPCDIKDLGLADQGKRRIEWAAQSMPVMQAVRKQLIKGQPLAGVRIGACLRVTAETANLMAMLRDGGAAVMLCASSSMVTQDDVAASLVRDYSIPTFAIRDESPEVYYRHILAVLESHPQITLDDGAELVTTLHTARKDLLEDGVLGGTEETTTGVQRLRAMAREGVLEYPVVAVNDAISKHLFDNRYGTGQSTVDGILRAANVLLAGSNVVVAGYGACGRGCALRARGMGAGVIVTEVDPLRAIEAAMDGFRVMSMQEAAGVGDVFITVTGNKNVIGRDHFEKLKNGAFLCNSGHSNVEIDLESLGRAASGRRRIREFVEEYAMRDGRRIYVLCEGRLINLMAGEGHPSAVMDISFANQALSVEYLVKHHASLERRVHAVPEDLDRSVAKLKLESMGIKIDRLTVEQEQYLASWSEGT